MLHSFNDECGIWHEVKTKVLKASDKHKDLYMVLLHKQLGNIVFRVNKTKENRFKLLDHQMGKPACQTTSHTGLFGRLVFPSSV